MSQDKIKPLISIVTPCYNEEANVFNHFEKVTRALEPFSDVYNFEYIYTDNQSQDAPFECLRQLGAKNSNVRALRFSRNIGANRAIYLGLMQAKGDATILIQADLQDPPELIPEFIRQWQAGFEVVYGQIQNRDESWLMRSIRSIYYRFITKLADYPVPRNAGEFRLTSRRVLDAVALYTEDDLYLRGAIAHIGFRQTAIPYHRAARAAGTTSTNFLFLIGYALNGLISTSTALPLRFVIFVGISLALLGLTYFAFIVIAKLFFPAAVPAGFATVIALVTLFSGFQLFALGVVGEYIRKIYIQSLRRPLGFIQDRINC